MQLEIGTICEGKVTSILNFGAFVSLPDGSSGLVHISEISNTYVRDIHEHLTTGQTVTIKIVGRTPDGKINLSIKKAAPAEEPRHTADRAPRQPVRSAPPKQQPAAPDFEQRLKQFMQESDSRIADSRLYANRKGTSRRRNGGN